MGTRKKMWRRGGWKMQDVECKILKEGKRWVRILSSLPCKIILELKTRLVLAMQGNKTLEEK